MDYEHIKLGNNNFFTSFFAYPLAPRKEKCACGLLKEQKEAFKISSFFCSPVINQGHINKVIELQTNIQEAQLQMQSCSYQMCHKQQKPVDIFKVGMLHTAKPCVL